MRVKDQKVDTPSESKMVSVLDVSAHGRFQLEITEHGGRRFVSLRKFYNTKLNPEWKPTKAGFSVEIDGENGKGAKAQLKALARMLRQAAVKL